MSTSGWIVMIVACGSITALMAWCIYRVLATPGSTKHLHSQADIETPDIEDE